MRGAECKIGKGKRKTLYQRLYEKVCDCCKKLKSYAQKIAICGEDRNSYSKTDQDATFLRSAPVKGNQFGRTAEYYQCEDCAGCPHREKCHKSKGNRVVRVNEDLTKFHNKVLNNLNCVHGALLRVNRSIQAEGTFCEIKWNKGYKRLRRRGIESVILELGLISCGFNFYKYHLKKLAVPKAGYPPKKEPQEIHNSLWRGLYTHLIAKK